MLKENRVRNEVPEEGEEGGYRISGYKEILGTF